MVRTKGPAVSLGASGSIAGALTFSSNKGRSYAKKLTIPTNPQSTQQTAQRAIQGLLAKSWAGLISFFQETWEDIAEDYDLSNYHAYLKINTQRWSRGKYPGTIYPITEVGTPLVGGNLNPVARLRTILLAPSSGSINQNWGIVVHRSTSTGFSPSRANAIGSFIFKSGDLRSFTDGPLEPDTYYYRGIPFSTDGNPGAAMAEESAVIP